MTDTVNKPGAADTRPTVWSIAGPSILVFMMTTLSQVVIIRLVSGLGTDAVAIVTAGQRINFMISALLIGLGAATTALVARAWGAKEPGQAAGYVRLALAVSVTTTGLLVIGGFIGAEPLTHFFKLNDTSRPEAINYLHWICIAGIGQSIVVTLSTSCRAVGDAKSPLYLGSATNLLSILSAYAFAYGKWGAPNMGVVGAAIGWAVAFSFCAVAYVICWWRGKLTLPFSAKSTGEHAPSLRRYLHVCTPATIEQMTIQLALLIFMGFVAGYGTAAFAAYGVGMNLFAVALVIALGFSIASSSLVGQALGANDPDGAYESANQALKMSLTTMLFSGAISALFAEPLAAAMVDDPEVIRHTAQFMVALAVVQPLLASDFAMAGAMRGAGDTRFPLICGIATIFGVRLPLAALVVWLQLPVWALYSVLVVDQLIKVAIISTRYRKRAWLGALS